MDVKRDSETTLLSHLMTFHDDYADWVNCLVIENSNDNLEETVVSLKRLIANLGNRRKES